MYLHSKCIYSYHLLLWFKIKETLVQAQFVQETELIPSRVPRYLHIINMCPIHTCVQLPSLRKELLKFAIYTVEILTCPM